MNIGINSLLLLSVIYITVLQRRVYKGHVGEIECVLPERRVNYTFDVLFHIWHKVVIPYSHFYLCESLKNDLVPFEACNLFLYICVAVHFTQLNRLGIALLLIVY